MTPKRRAGIAAFYAENEHRLRNAVKRDTGASAEVVEDACQTAWVTLLRRDDVALDNRGFAWLCRVARTAGLRRASCRDVPVGAFLPAAGDQEPGAIAEPAAETGDPLVLALAHEHSEQLRHRLLALTDRERRYLALHAAGLRYREIAQAEGGVSLRTVERQILRGRRKLKRGG
jgi:RNA polymerase sigma factor (sigma-70 family)